jgi:hypothetical protein
VVTLCVAVAALRLGRDLLIPLALALLMALLLSGIVEALRRYCVPRGHRGPDEHQYIAVRALPGNPRGERETLLVFALPH